MTEDLSVTTEEIFDDKFLNELKRTIYRESYYEFFKACFPLISGGDALNDNWHIKYICDRLQKELNRIIAKKKREKDIIINVPFRSSKSRIVTIAFPVWSWIIRPETKFICTSFSGSLALEHADIARQLISSEWFQTLFGEDVKMRQDGNQKGFYENTKQGFRKSIGMGGQITGSGADIILCLPKGQNISTEEGELDIADIVENKKQVGVDSYDHNLNTVESQPIKRYDKNPGRRLIKVKTETSEIICTEDHPIWTVNRGYVEAKNLTINDTLLKKD